MRKLKKLSYLGISILVIFFAANLSAQDINVKIGGTGASDEFQVTDSNGNVKFVIQGDGKVGIGTNTPSALIDMYYDYSDDGIDNDGDMVTDEADEGFSGFVGTSSYNFTAKYGFGATSSNATVTIYPKFGSGETTIANHYNLLSTASIYPVGITITNWYGLYVKNPTGTTYVNKYAFVSEEDAGNVGIGIIAPARILHVKDVMRLEPRSSAPSSPSAGDLYFNSSDNKLKCYDGTVWQNCF